MATSVETFKRTDIWRERKWLDLWSVVHFLSGISIGLGLYSLHFGSTASVAITLLLLISYEMWEMLVQIEETPTNRLMDVVVGMTSFLPSFFLLAPAISPIQLIRIFILVFIANVAMSIFGWRASQKASALAERMRIQYMAQRARLLREKIRFGQRFKRTRKRGL